MQGNSGSSAPAVSLKCPVTCLCHRFPGLFLHKESAPDYSLLPGAPTTQRSICSWPTVLPALKALLNSHKIKMYGIFVGNAFKKISGGKRKKKKEPPYTLRFRNIYIQIK